VSEYALNTTGMVRCERCDALLRIGDYPFCPHGHGSTGIEDATWPGGKVFENLGNEPIRCDSPADLKRELKARNLEPFVRHIDGSPHTRSWATMDPYTLNAASELVARAGKTTTAPEPLTWIQSMTTTITDAPDTPLRVLRNV
jgi:hypothetical protein